MNKVDIYINGFRLDLFDDEEITINLSVQNVQDISKVFTDFTQGFTVPASAWNNAIFQHYYRSDIDSSTLTKKTLLNGESLFLDYKFRVLKDGGTIEAATCCADALDALGGSLTSTTTAVSFDGRLRQEARIEINSLPFRTGVVEIENVQLKGTEPYAYTITFYGDVVTLSDLFGDDYLYDLDFGDYNFDYTDDEVFDRLTTEAFDPVFMPLMSPVQNWFYNSSNSAHDDNNIAYHTTHDPHGIHYYEFKPAIKVWAVLEAMEAKYGITFTGSFIESAPFTDLSLWLHRAEGYLFANGNDIAWTLINFTRNTGSGSDFNLATETWTSPADNDYRFVVTMANVNENYELGIFIGGQLNGSAKVNAHPSTSVQTTFDLYVSLDADVQLFIRPQQVTSITFTSTDYSCDQLDRETGTPVANEFSVDQTASQTVGFIVDIQQLMPEIKVKDFLGGIVKMYNMVIQPSSPTSFLLQPLDDWYAAGTDQNYQTYFDITEYTVNRTPLYREIEFKYQETQQILGAQYLNTNNTGFGDLRAFFNFDGDEFVIETPFECPLFERLTDENGGALTNVLVYKSITNELADDGVSFKPYLGAPILFYAQYGLDVEGNPINFTNSDDSTNREVQTCWYANVSNSTTLGTANSICFGADIDPYHLTSVSKSLYYNYWSEYITDLYNKGRRLIQIDAVLPVGKMITMNLKNAVIWNNEKYIVNNVNLNMTTGKATFELLNVV
jgi:hypothetical protein